MARARFAYSNLATAAATTITASSEVADRPDDFLKSAARWKKWRSSTTTGGHTVEFDFGSSQTVKVVALVDWRAHTGGSITAETWNGSTWDAFGTFTLASPNPTGVIALWDTTGVSTAKVRISFVNTGSVSSYVELGVAIIGTYFEPTYTLSDGFSLMPVDPSVIVASLDGQEEAQERAAYHVARGEFETLGAADLAGFRALFTAVGHRTPFLFAIDPDSAGEMLYGRLVDSPYEHQYQNTWSFPVTVREVR
jgi:hypothetical protein